MAPHLVASNASLEVDLTRVVELEIIPRLMLMHSAQPLPERPRRRGVVLGAEQVQALAHLAVEGSSDGAASYVAAWLDAGASEEQVFLDLLAPCARWLGAQWEDDRCSFSEVTVGLWRLQSILHQHARPDGGHALGVGARSGASRVLLAAVPGSQHTFGVTMVAEWFARAGWQVASEPGADWSGLCQRVASEWMDVVGLSVSLEEDVPQVASAILDIRSASTNPSLLLMVGGPLVARLPDLAARCGADVAPVDAPAAVLAASHWVQSLVKRA